MHPSNLGPCGEACHQRVEPEPPLRGEADPFPFASRPSLANPPLAKRLRNQVGGDTGIGSQAKVALLEQQLPVGKDFAAFDGIASLHDHPAVPLPGPPVPPAMASVATVSGGSQPEEGCAAPVARIVDGAEARP